MNLLSNWGMLDVNSVRVLYFFIFGDVYRKKVLPLYNCVESILKFN